MRLDKPVGEALDAFTLRKWRELVPSLSDSDLSQLRQCLLDRLTRYGINARFERMSYEEILDLDDMAQTEESRRIQERTERRMQRRSLTRQQPWHSKGYEHLSPHHRASVVESQKDSAQEPKGEQTHEYQKRKRRTRRRN